MSDRNNVFLYYTPTDEVEVKLEKLKELGREHGLTLVDDASKANIIASIGGDGAFLQAIRKTGFREDCLYVGINDGRLGFYTDFNLDDLDGIKAGLQSDMVEVLRYPILDVTVDGNENFHCINECSIRSNIIKTFAIDVYIDNIYFETFRGDGMVVSTPTGSTAYNKSLRGAIVDPRLASMQLTEIASLNNNEYRTLGSPLLLNKDRELVLKIVQDGNDHPIIGADNEALSIRHSHEVKIKVSDKMIKTIKLKDNSFVHKVKRSFL
ncbi:NAD kinase [Evansella cellulosilytica]|uniref:NAD kinase n=1 Tax=Evansella cellulosilytica (strain ATCC 21833 / DSM 2522 / FERM P-1141 / JCM 9156 / N-4) TaxID=649639 RepID=E6U147_EVAC2|nr:NAD kinase [Evansella cellulosilytica]ADU31493.1 ATP-NAD/AcoX kinase [Evansella cellulosilytica DSM 2522]